MMRLLGIVLLTLLVSGCSRYETWDANIVAYNRSPNTLTVIVEGNKLGKLLPNNTANFSTPITTPRDPNTVTGPSYGREAWITVTVINEATGIMSNPISCRAGERWRTVLTYESAYQAPGGYQNLYCITQ